MGGNLATASSRTNRPSQAAILSSLLLDPGGTGGGEKWAQSIAVLRPFAYTSEWRSPNTPDTPGTLGPPVEKSCLLPGAFLCPGPAPPHHAQKKRPRLRLKRAGPCTQYSARLDGKRKCGFRSKAIRDAGIGSRKKAPPKRARVDISGVGPATTSPTRSPSRANTSELGRRQSLLARLPRPS